MLVLPGRSQLPTTAHSKEGGEMAFRTFTVGLLLSSLSTVGCGTIKNTVLSNPAEGGKTPFGGVRQDQWCIHKAASGELAPVMPPKPEQQPGPHDPQVGLMLLAAADVPF